MSDKDCETCVHAKVKIWEEPCASCNNDFNEHTEAVTNEQMIVPDSLRVPD